MNLNFENGLNGWTPAPSRALAATWDVYTEPDTTEGTSCLRFVGDTRSDMFGVPEWTRIDCAEVFLLEGERRVTVSVWTRQTYNREDKGNVDAATLERLEAIQLQYATTRNFFARARWGVDWLDSSGALIGTSFGVEASGLFNDFNWARGEVEAPSTATGMRLFLEAAGARNTECLFDSLGVRIGSTLYGTDVDATFYKPLDRIRGWREVQNQQQDPRTRPVSSGGVPYVSSPRSQQLAETKLPANRQPAVDREGRMTPPLYNWAQQIDKGVAAITKKLDDVSATVDAIPPALGSADGTVGGIPVPQQTRVLAIEPLRSTPIDNGALLSLDDLVDDGTGELLAITRDAKGRVQGTRPANADDIRDASRLTLTAAGAISALRMVAAENGTGRYPDTDAPADAGRVVGMAVTAADDGAPFQIVTDGEWTDDAWTWTPGPVFCGDEGVLTQAVPSGWVLMVGQAMSATRLLIDVRIPFLRT